MIRENSGDEFESARSLEQALSFGAAEKAFADAGVPFGTAQRKSLGVVSEDGTYSNLALLLSDQCPFTSKLAVCGDDAKMEFRDRLETTGSREDVQQRCDVSSGTAVRDLRKLLADGKIAKDGGGPRTTYRKT